MKFPSWRVYQPADGRYGFLYRRVYLATLRPEATIASDCATTEITDALKAHGL
jgi:hypothetical protein